jgi:hypothetical protein
LTSFSANAEKLARRPTGSDDNNIKQQLEQIQQQNLQTAMQMMSRL